MKSLKKMLCGIKPLSCIIIALSGVFLAFGLYNVHSLSGVTEGGILGLNLLLEYWFNISPAVTNFVFSAICYFIGWRTLGREFIVYSAVAASSFSLSYAVFERFPPLWPELYGMPLAAAFLGAVFVGDIAEQGACKGLIRSGDPIENVDDLMFGRPMPEPLAA